MARYILVGLSTGLAVSLDGEKNYVGIPFFELGFDVANHLGDGVELAAALKNIGPDLSSFERVSLDIQFLDMATGDQIYRIQGLLDPDEENISSIVSIMEAMEDFSNVELIVKNANIQDIKKLDCFNAFNSLGRNKEVISVPAAPMPIVADVYDILTAQDIEPIALYMQFTNDFGLFTQLLQTANKLNIALWVELDPNLTTDQALQIASDLAPLDHHVRLLWSPIRARPMGAVGLKGKKIARHTGGYLMGQLLKRRAQTNSAGIPPLHRPIAGFDYPIPFLGIEQNPEVLFRDHERKALAEVQLNYIERMRSANGVRFIIGDCLTANGDHKSALKLSNVSDISMFIDNRLKDITKRHLLKPTDDFIQDALDECQKFLDACTTKERRLLKKSTQFAGFYSLSIVPREDRPDDAVNLKCGYHPEGATRAIYFDTEVTKN